MEKMETREMISALADGQLQGEAFACAVEAASGTDNARQAWQTYHLIGDVLRCGQMTAVRAPAHAQFMDRLQASLANEPAFKAPVAPAASVFSQLVRTPAANDAAFRWKMVAGFASLAAVAAIGWTVVGIGAKPEQAQLAQLAGTPQAGTVAVDGERGVMIRDARLDELLAAHRQLGGASALQMPAGFLRNATFEPAR